MKVKIAPSILSADFSDIGQTVKKLKGAGADLVHLDVMDGSFVAPITFGAQLVKNIRSKSDLPFDAHLMIEHPKTQIESFCKAGADIITVHFEACKKISESYLCETLDLIKSFNVKCGVSINPDTPTECIFPVIKKVDLLLIMSVNPGYGGQKFIPSALEKIKEAKKYISENGLKCEIEVDGGVTTENCKQIVSAGADILVAGNTIFSSVSIAETIKKLRGD